MQEYFQGWRRKAGCAVAFIACLFVFGWTRSLVMRDSVTFVLSGEQHWIVSRQGRIHWESWQKSMFVLHQVPSFYIESAVMVPEEPLPLQARLMPGMYLPSRGWDIPYWSLLIPLSLLSAYLLLVKQRVVATPARQRPFHQRFREFWIPRTRS